MNATGSPPQVRGKLPKTGAKTRRYRITPAGAGKTRPWYRCSRPCKDHPRRCGENTNSVTIKMRILGSPPQVRGKPALSVPCTQRTKDHPRRCGENAEARAKDTEQMGSPPQVRGKPLHNTAWQYQARITPAGAGKTKFTDIKAENL